MREETFETPLLVLIWFERTKLTLQWIFWENRIIMHNKSQRIQHLKTMRRVKKESQSHLSSSQLIFLSEALRISYLNWKEILMQNIYDMKTF